MAPESDKHDAPTELMEYRMTQIEKDVSWIKRGIITIVVVLLTLVLNVFLMQAGLPTV